MRVKQEIDLLAVSITTSLFVLLVIFVSSTVLRIIVGLPLLLFLPGYTLIAALFPRRGDLEGIERIALGFGVSICITILIGIVLNFFWRLDVYPELITLAIFILVTSGVAWYRRRKAGSERFTFSFNIRLPSWGTQSLKDRVIYLVLGVLILGAIGALGYVITLPKAEETLTEFYILGAGANSEIYPTELRVTEEGKVLIGIANHEHEEVNYQIKVETEDQIAVRLDGKEIQGNILVVLKHEEKWEGEMILIPREAGENQKIEFWIYKEGSTEPYLEDPLRLWLDVRH